MFTGLIEDIGTLVGIGRHWRTATLLVRTGLPAAELRAGDSVAVNGACLTVEGISANIVRFHCLAETLSRTNLGSCDAGAPLNLERALRVGERLGGHFVSGHVDYCGKVLAAGRRGDDFTLEVSFPPEERAHIVMKGSVALNGVSLTIAGLTNDSLSVCLIPFTISKTNLETLRPGDSVNVETDILGKYVAGALAINRHATADDKPTLDSLREAGFL